MKNQETSKTEKVVFEKPMKTNFTLTQRRDYGEQT
jgi:hypothetical protein